MPLPRANLFFFVKCADFSAANTGFNSKLAESIGRWQNNTRRNDLQGRKGTLGIHLPLEVNHSTTLHAPENLSLHRQKGLTYTISQSQNLNCLLFFTRTKIYLGTNAEFYVCSQKRNAIGSNKTKRSLWQYCTGRTILNCPC